MPGTPCRTCTLRVANYEMMYRIAISDRDLAKEKRTRALTRVEAAKSEMIDVLQNDFSTADLASGETQSKVTEAKSKLDAEMKEATDLDEDFKAAQAYFLEIDFLLEQARIVKGSCDHTRPVAINFLPFGFQKAIFAIPKDV